MDVNPCSQLKVHRATENNKHKFCWTAHSSLSITVSALIWQVSAAESNHNNV